MKLFALIALAGAQARLFNRLADCGPEGSEVECKPNQECKSEAVRFYISPLVLSGHTKKFLELFKSLRYLTKL